MIEESFSLNEVVINPKINPAIAIIKMQYQPKKILKTAPSMPTFILEDFQTKKCTKKDIGSKIGDLNGSLDSTGTGIISLSKHFLKLLLKNPII
jgi:K+/H+ antiporter YhaU regulatory subunit KhtT